MSGCHCRVTDGSELLPSPFSPPVSPGSLQHSAPAWLEGQSLCLVTLHITQGMHDAPHVDSAKTINAVGGITLICALEGTLPSLEPGRILLILKMKTEGSGGGGGAALTYRRGWEGVEGGTVLLEIQIPPPQLPDEPLCLSKRHGGGSRPCWGFPLQVKPRGLGNKITTDREAGTEEEQAGPVSSSCK